MSYEKDSLEVNARAIIKDTTDTRLHYGFIAQEMQTVFPELVYKGSDSLLSIDYIGLIPFLVEYIKNQQTEIEQVKLELAELKSLTKNSKLKSETESSEAATDATIEARLEQNKPNPFSQSTTVEMTIPTAVVKATVYIYDLKGNQILSKPVSGRGTTNITIQANELSAGMYIYSLITDSELVGSKQMIVTE